MIVTLYTKDDCGLCDEAAVMLRRLQRQIRFEIEYVDVEADPVAGELYGMRIPVIVADGVEVAAAPIDEQTLVAALSR